MKEIVAATRDISDRCSYFINCSSPQKSFYNLMTGDKKSEKFFRVLHDRMKKAQQEVKSTVTVNMSDIGNKPHEDKDSPDHGSKGIWKRWISF